MLHIELNQVRNIHPASWSGTFKALYYVLRYDEVREEYKRDLLKLLNTDDWVNVISNCLVMGVTPVQADITTLYKRLRLFISIHEHG